MKYSCKIDSKTDTVNYFILYTLIRLFQISSWENFLWKQHPYAGTQFETGTNKYRYYWIFCHKSIFFNRVGFHYAITIYSDTKGCISNNNSKLNNLLFMKLCGETGSTLYLPLQFNQTKKYVTLTRKREIFELIGPNVGKVRNKKLSYGDFMGIF